VYALLTDGTMVEIRRGWTYDVDAVQTMHGATARDDIYGCSVWRR
jgi:hypothetical protein